MVSRAPPLPYPPTHPHPHLTRALGPSETEAQLRAFLKKTPTSPHLHPDSLLSSRGITYSAASGPQGGLCLHHLDRIARGLGGEELGIEIADDGGAEGDDAAGGVYGDEELGEGQALKEATKGARGKRKAEEIEAWSEGVGAKAEEWQDKEEYEKKQKVVEGEVGEREGAPLAGRNATVPEVVMGDGEGREVSKEERKAKKKEGKKRLRKEKAKAAGAAQG